MKKYVRPELVYEHFELSEQIAACTYDLNFTSVADCAGKGYIGTDIGYPSDLILIGSVGEDGCQVVEERVCYQPGTDGFNTFNS